MITCGGSTTSIEEKQSVRTCVLCNACHTVLGYLSLHPLRDIQNASPLSAELS